jgi:hypothetical protein
MRTDGLGYMKHSIASVLVLVLLICALPGVVRANKLVQINPCSTKFVMEKKPLSVDEDTKADRVITLSWHQNVKDESESLPEVAGPSEKPKRKTVTYRATKLVCEGTGREISPIHIGARIETSTGDELVYQSLEYATLFLRPEDDWAKVTLRLAPEAWGPAGTYSGWLWSDELGESGKIRVHAKIDDYIDLSVNKTRIEIEADHGPGTYLALEPIKAHVIANHDWTLTITGDPLEYDADFAPDEELPQIESSNVFIKLEGDPDEKWKNLESGMTLHGSPDFEIREFSFVIKVETELEHTAGTYAGKLHFTLSK